jgi:hypothetical protein
MLQALVKFKPETEEKIYYYEKISSFSISLLSFIGLSIYNENQSAYFLKLISYMLSGYLFCDLFIAKGDAIWHHIFCLCCGYSGIQFIPMNLQYILFLPTFNTEISTIFFTTKLWLDEYKGKKNSIFNIFYGVNDLLFFSLFFKLRIYDYYFKIVQNPEAHTVITNNIVNDMDKILIYIGLYGLFGLNIYWFSIICKKLYKQIVIKMVPFLDSKKIAECMLTVSFFVNFYIAYVNYSVNMNSYHLFDLCGLFMLSIASGNYHYSKYKYMENNQDVNVFSNELIEHFMYDKYAIQMRSFFALTTVYLANGTSNKIVYLSGFYHIMSFLSFNMNTIKLIIDNDDCESEVSKNIMKKLDIITIIPCLLDTAIVILYHTNNVCLKSELFFISVMIYFVLSVKPFYNLNHVLLHVLLMYQTNCITKYALQNM